MNTTVSKPDRGFRRALLCGLVGFLGYILAWTAVSGGMSDPESQGRVLFSCLAPAVVTGLIVKGRRWSWPRIAVVYAGIAVALLAVTVLPKFNGVGR